MERERERERGRGREWPAKAGGECPIYRRKEREFSPTRVY
jgi:hypothetical protein